MKLPNPEGGPEKWIEVIRDTSGNAIRNESRLVIKPEASTTPGIHPISQYPRFEARIGRGKYINPFTSKVGTSRQYGHVWLDNPYLTIEEQEDLLRDEINVYNTMRMHS